MRFLWFSDTKNIDYTNFENNLLAEYRLCRVLFGATCSSFILTGTLISHFNQYTEEPEFVKKVLESLQVDDIISGSETVSDAISFYENCKKKLKDGAINLRKFHSNSVLAENIVNSVDSTEIEFNEYHKVLGLTWNKSNDTFQIS